MPAHHPPSRHIAWLPRPPVRSRLAVLYGVFSLACLFALLLLLSQLFNYPLGIKVGALHSLAAPLSTALPQAGCACFP